jgi:hypothetical protein
MDSFDEDFYTGKLKAYTILSSKFWDTDYTITKNYGFKKKRLDNAIKNSVNEDDVTKLKLDRENLENAYEILMSNDVYILY